MIRVNLLPFKKARKREEGQRQLVYMGAGVAVALGVVVFVHLQISGEVESLQAQNAAIQADIERFKTEMGDYDKIKAQREELLKQQKTIQDLQSARTGPVFLMRELAEILTAGKGPTFDRISYEESLRRDPNAGFNASWDTRRVWLESFEEEEHKVKIRGGAKSSEDVAEFLKRLQTSVFFKDVAFDGTQQATSGNATNAVKHMTFSLAAEVVY